MDVTPQAKTKQKPLGITSSGQALLVYCFDENKDKKDSSVIFKDVAFKKLHTSPRILVNDNESENLTRCQNFRISADGERNLLTYILKEKSKKILCIAASNDLVNWKRITKVEGIGEVGVIVPNYKYKNSYVLFYGEKRIKAALSQDLKQWQKNDSVLIKPPEEYEEYQSVGANGAAVTDDGILLLYYTKTEISGHLIYSLSTALFDSNNPTRLLWQLEHPLWFEPEEWIGKKVHPLGIVSVKNDIASFWYVEEENTVYAALHLLFRDVFHPRKHDKILFLNKHRHNPILKPISYHWWESQAVFNPAAYYDEEDDKVHLLYRAVGHQYVSVLGYATSRDGMSIDERLTYPVYLPREPFEGVSDRSDLTSPFVSGLGYGGCEDPRITRLGNRLYITYVAFNGWEPPRVALSSISIEDFKKRRWNWSKPVLISKPGVVDKNCVILPEKINGKYVIFHRIFPNILIDYVDNLDFDGKTFLKGEYKIEPSNRSGWDSRKIGAGPPPIKTKDGWLLIYHAVDDKDDSRYKMGAMLLDLKDPSKVLARTKRPILEPREWYENEGHKYGVAYPCGAIVKDNLLHVYYGGADTVICAATTNVDNFTKDLMTYGATQFAHQII